MKKLFRILRYAKPYWLYAMLNILFNILSTLFSLVSFTLFIPVLNMLFQKVKVHPVAPAMDLSQAHSFGELTKMLSFASLQDNFNYFFGSMILEHGEKQMLLYISITIVVLFFLRNVFRYLAMFFLATVRNGVVRDIRSQLYYKALILPLGYYNEQRKGDIISRMTTDVQEVEWSIMSSLEMFFRDPIAIIAYMTVLFAISPKLTIFILILLPLSGLIIGQIGKSLKRTSDKGQRQMGILLSIIEETLSGLRIIKAFTAIDFADKRFQQTNNHFFRLMVRLYRKRDLASPLSEFLGAVVISIVLWFGGQLVFTPGNLLDAATFLTYMVIFSQIINPAKTITQAWYSLQKGAASLDRIQQVLNEPELIVEKPNAVTKKTFEKEIEFSNVSFAYVQEEVLKEIRLTIPKGRTIALVGTSGGGKSTMVDLLPRFYDCKKGEILIDGVPIQNMVINDLRGLMGIVSQETILFNDTVFNNIAFGMETASEEAVISAAKVANAHEFIENMPFGYQTNIGDRGVKLSGGQKQRLSIARAVLKNPPIMILDEATSALDTESERLVQQALENLMKNRTSIVIAHRLSTIQFADEIIVLQSGEIVERGTHAELLERNGVYRKLSDLQSFV
ncbi:MAG: ABC transporter ATP-binding protein [Bacteroidota bacterium]